MAEVGGKIRLFVRADLGPEVVVSLEAEQAHYLFNVMRLGPEAPVTIFNGRDGEWFARVSRVARNGGELSVHAPGQPQRRPPDLTLHFAPIKKARTDFIVEKATELGCARIAPVFTRHTNSERLRLDRLRAHAIEAAEQCGETHVPELAEPVRLDKLLDGWDPARRLLFCDEQRVARPAAEALAGEAPGAPWAILIGPEGGFAEEELERLRAAPFVLSVTLGPRVLRADTAAVAAIALWQTALGIGDERRRSDIGARLRDWREPIVWGALLALGVWLLYVGYRDLALLSFLAGLVASATGFGLLRDALRRRRLRSGVPSEGMVVIDEARIGYFGPRGGGFVDLPAVASVEIVTRPHVPPDSALAWLIRSEDGSTLTIPLGAHGAEGLISTLSALPGIDFDLGAEAVAGSGARRATLWRKAG